MGTLSFPDVPFSGTLYEDVEAFLTSLDRGSPLLDFEELGRLVRMEEDLDTSVDHLKLLREMTRKVIADGVYKQRDDEFARSGAGVS